LSVSLATRLVSGRDGPGETKNYCDQFEWVLMPTTGKVTRWL